MSTTYRDIYEPDVCRCCVQVDGLTMFWYSSVLAANTETRTYITPLSVGGRLIDCTSGCDEICGGNYAHWELPNGRHVAVRYCQVGRLEFIPWSRMTRSHQIAQAILQGNLDRQFRSTNWGASHYDDPALLGAYNQGYNE